MEPDELTSLLRAKSVDRVCPACRVPRIGGTVEVELGAPFVGWYCDHCGCLRLFHRETLEASED